MITIVHCLTTIKMDPDDTVHDAHIRRCAPV